MKQTLLVISFLLFSFPFAAFADNKSSLNRLNNAAVFFHETNYTGAIEELKAVGKDAKEGTSISYKTFFLLGMSYIELKEWNDAIEWLKKASRDRLLGDYALYYMGESCMSTGDYESALASYRGLTSRFPDSKWNVDASFKTAVAMLHLGQNNEALSVFDRFVRENPVSQLTPAALLSMAEILEEGGRLGEAYDSYKKVWLNYPSSPESGTASARMTKLSSMPSFNPSLSPSFDERYKRAETMFSNGSYEDVISDLSSLLKDVEKYESGRPQWLMRAKFNLAESYFNTKGFAKAEIILKRLIDDNLTEETLYLYARVLQRSGKRDGAAAFYEMIHEDYPSGDYSARALYRLADMAEVDGSVLKAKELYHKVYISYPKSDLADDSLWKEGWLNYLDRSYDKAAENFQKILNEYPSSEFADTGSYWSGRLAERTGNKDEAISKYSNIINQFPLSFYSVLSRERLYTLLPEASLLNWTKSDNLPPSIKGQTTDKSVLFHLKRGKLLLSLGFKKDASEELAMAESRCNNKAVLLQIAGLQTEAGDYFRPQRVILNNFQKYLKDDKGSIYADIWAFAFPLGFSEYIRENADKNSLNQYLIHAIIREESTYRPEIVSRAGAIGLMQMMPTTGNEISKKYGFKDFTSQDLYKPYVNITMGSIYIRKLIEAHGGNLALAVASYNAGPNAVGIWISRYGTEEMDEFIERIPYSETRNYVKKVLRSYDIYERLYNGKNRSNDSEILSSLR